MGFASNTLSCFAQVKGGQYSKLFDLYAMEKFEDCAYKAENMALNDKYKKDPEPLLYLSMCMLKISKMDSSSLDQKYKDPLKESLKYAKKFKAKDKTGTMYAENLHFFAELKGDAIIQANVLYNQNQFAKASAVLGMINAYDEKDDNVRFTKGVYDILGKNLVEGNKGINDALKGLNVFFGDSSNKPDLVSGNLLSQAFIIYSDYLNKNSMQDSAKKTILRAKKYFPDNFEIKNQYNLLNGLPLEVMTKNDTTSKAEKKYEFHKSKENDNVEIPPTQAEPEIPADSVKINNREEATPEPKAEEEAAPKN